jgi:hypothetical protein
LHPGLIRAGGNRWTTYNWVNNASNAGSDYNYENDGYLSNSNAPGDAVSQTLAGAQARGAASLITIPIVDFVAADKLANGDVRNSGSNYLQTRFRQNHAAKGAPFLNPPDATSPSVYQDEFVSWLKATYPGSNVIISLDNEPDLWASTHPEVHPAPATYAEMIQRTVAFASAIKAVWPDRLLTGWVSYGWSGYDSLQNAPDAAGKGEFIDYYLQQMRAAQASAGRRLIDVLDLHWYPEATGTSGARITGTSTASDVVQARVQAPRSLWDPSYTENSWIAQ